MLDRNEIVLIRIKYKNNYAAHWCGVRTITTVHSYYLFKKDTRRDAAGEMLLPNFRSRSGVV
jgi:hypothetical protein